MLHVREDADDNGLLCPPLPRRHLLKWFLGGRLPKKYLGKYVHYLIPEGQGGGARGRILGSTDETQRNIRDDAIQNPQPIPGSSNVFLSDAASRARTGAHVGRASQTGEGRASIEQAARQTERTEDAAQSQTQITQVIDRLGAMDAQIGRRMSLLEERTERMEERVGRIEDAVGHVLQKLDAFAPAASTAPRW